MGQDLQTKENQMKFWLQSLQENAFDVFIVTIVIVSIIAYHYLQRWFLYNQLKELKSILLKAGFVEDIFIHNELKELIPIAIQYLKERKSKILLFSPACSSFDQFKDYEERGNCFKFFIKKYLPNYLTFND